MWSVQSIKVDLTLKNGKLEQMGTFHFLKNWNKWNTLKLNKFKEET